MVWHRYCRFWYMFSIEDGEIVHDCLSSNACFTFFFSYSWAGLLVWLLVMVGLVGLFVSIFKR